MKTFTVDNNLADELEHEIVVRSKPRYMYLKKTAEYNYRNDASTAGGIKIIHAPGFTDSVYSVNRDRTRGTYEQLFQNVSNSKPARLPSVSKLVVQLKKDFLDPSYDVIRVFVNMMPKGIEYGVTTPHHDVKDPQAVTFLYYVLDSDGDTFLFDEDQDKIICRCSPRKGTGLTYPSSTIHSASIPIHHEIRSAINIVYCKDYYKSNG